MPSGCLRDEGHSSKEAVSAVSNATTLKILAVVLMFMDHIHEMFADDLRKTGVSDFPVCLFGELSLYA